MAKTNEDKKLRGTLRADRISNSPMNGNIAIIDDVNEGVFINEYAYEEYKRCFIELSEIGVIQTTDLSSLIMLCDMWGVYCDQKDLIRGGKYISLTPNKMEQTSVSLTNFFRSYAEYNKLCKEFGLTPIARTKIEVSKVPPKDEGLGGLL